jgi:Papain-like cysteine protease AvrRpt2
MPDIYLDVPYVSQLNIGGHAGPGYDEAKGCWYAGACMLNYYRERGPTQGVPSRYGTDAKGNPSPLGANLNTFKQLAENEGFIPVTYPKSGSWTCDALHDILRTCGPIFCGRLFYMPDNSFYHHIVVVVGASASTGKLFVHDPNTGPNKQPTIDQFNLVFPWKDVATNPYLAMVKLPKLADGSTRARSTGNTSQPPVMSPAFTGS